MNSLLLLIILATEQLDFFPTTVNNMYFNSGDDNNSRLNFLIGINDDSQFEMMETFFVILLANDRGVRIATPRINVVILDGDCK